MSVSTFRIFLTGQFIPKPYAPLFGCCDALPIVKEIGERKSNWQTGAQMTHEERNSLLPGLRYPKLQDILNLDDWSNN